MTDKTASEDEESRVRKQVKEIRGFYSHLFTYFSVTVLLFIINFYTGGYVWAIYPALGWGFAIVLHGLQAFRVLGIFTAEWEEKEVAKRLQRKADKNQPDD